MKAMRTASKYQPLCEALSMVALGLCGESGEFADHIKKGLHHGHKIDRDYLTK
jgi:hypothetical protein